MENWVKNIQIALARSARYFIGLEPEWGQGHQNLGLCVYLIAGACTHVPFIVDVYRHRLKAKSLQQSL